VAYRVRCSFLPENETVRSKIDKLCQYELSIKEGAVLEPNCVYVIPLLENLKLDQLNDLQQKRLFDDEDTSAKKAPSIQTSYPLKAKANPKSSTGRLDVFTRVITDYSHRFEEIQPGYNGPLYLEVVPKTFPIRVKTGQRLNQLRVQHGKAPVEDEDLLRAHMNDPLLYHADGSPLSMSEIKVNNGLFLSVDLSGTEEGVVGYKAKNHRSYIDLEKVNAYNWQEFWEPIYKPDLDYLILEPEAFYIFASKEYCAIPPTLAAEMVAYDTGTGEIRSHYAGFFDSGFGHGVDRKGAKAVLEIRVHDVPFLIEDGQTICSMIFESNVEIPLIMYGNSLKNNYQGQGLKLGKHFK
jgi:dCTP deaminase